MRSVNKGKAPRAFTAHTDAKHPLAAKIGNYCSYCEVSHTEPAVEHIVPLNNGGAPLDWDNFLLSCWMCNSVKGTKNTARSGYLWPDVDNTYYAFDYDEVQNRIVAKVTPAQKEAAQTIGLFGLDRVPGSPVTPSPQDMRWLHRKKVWDIAQNSLRNWHKNPSPFMADQIANTSLIGFYSIWIKAFSGIPQVLDAINQEYGKIGTYIPVIDPNTGQLVVRPGGTF